VKRKIVRIDEERCTGCGLCVSACAEGALEMVGGKAKLVSESYCDGLGACLPECPADAIRIEEREAAGFDEDAVAVHMAAEKAPAHVQTEHAHSGGCPGSRMRVIERRPGEGRRSEGVDAESRLGQWPVQLRLVPATAPFLEGADILVCADCVPFALAGFHERYLGGKAVLVGCPKLDDLGYYAEKLKQMVAAAKPRSLTVLRMEVPCCGGIAQAVIQARDASAPELPVTVETIGISGEVLGKKDV